MIDELIKSIKDNRDSREEYMKTHGTRPLIAFIGSPGSGKSTQAEALTKRISKYSGVHHVNTGQLLRDSADKEVVRIMNEGLLVPDEVVFQHLEDKFSELGEGFIVMDGFFRTGNEADWLIKNQKRLDVDLQALVNIKLSDEEAIERLRSRGRADDEDEDIKVRLDVFKQNRVGVLRVLEENGVWVLEIDGSPDPEAIANSIYLRLGEWVNIPGWEEAL